MIDRIRADLRRRLRIRNWARAALERYGLRGARFALIKGGPGKLLFGVRSRHRGGFLLRVYEPHRRRDADFIESELIWLQALRREAGLPAPEPVRAEDGSLVPHVSFEGAFKPRPCVLLRWVPGTPGVGALGPEDISLIGSYAARLHRHSEQYDPPEKFVRPREWEWEWVFGEAAPLWSEGERFLSASELEALRAAAERVRADLRDLGEDRSVFGIIHRDLTPENFVFHEDRAYAIDFDQCGPGHYLFDLAVTLSALEAYGQSRAPTLQAALIEGYREERRLPEGHLRYLDTFMALRGGRRINRAIVRTRNAHYGRRPVYLAKLVEALKSFEVQTDGADTLRTPWW